MKKLITIALTATFTLILVAVHAQRTPERGITVSNIVVVPSEDEVRLDMELTVKGDAVTKLQGMAIVPYFSDNDLKAEFPYVLVNSKNRNRIFERQKEFRNTEIITNPPLEVVVVDRKHRDETINYSARIARRPWMDNAVMNFRFSLISPAGETLCYTVATSETNIAERIVTHEPVPSEPIIVEQKQVPVPVVVAPELKPEPSIAVMTRHSISGTVLLDFQAIMAMFTSVQQAMEEIDNDPSARIVALEITGYSSPEGPAFENRTLARERAMAFAHYMQKGYGVSPAITNIHSGGEDWSGLRNMVAESDIPYKNAVLQVFDSGDEPDVKESKLMRAMGGSIWRMMTIEMFPKLRRVEYRIDYETAACTD